RSSIFVLCAAGDGKGRYRGSERFGESAGAVLSRPNPGGSRVQPRVADVASESAGAGRIVAAAQRKCGQPASDSGFHATPRLRGEYREICGGATGAGRDLVSAAGGPGRF